MVALVVALVALVGLRSGGDARLPAAATPEPDDELVEVDVVRADGPAGLPDADPGQLEAPVHAVSAVCNVNLRDFPASSAYHVLTDTVSSADGPTRCRAQPLPDGRVVGTFGWGTDDLSVGVIDPRHPSDGPQPAPAGLGDQFVAGSKSVSEATRIWFGPLDGAIEMVREPYPLPLPDGGEVEPRDLLPPRIVDGTDGPLVAPFEHLSSADTWQLVLIAPDGATRVAAELEGRGPLARSTADEPRSGSALLGSGGPGVSFDAFGNQMLIAGTVIGDGADDPEGTPTVLLLDLDQGIFSRLPVEATSATFVRTLQ